jgi:excisionase family DNA binding protein
MMDSKEVSEQRGVINEPVYTVRDIAERFKVTQYAVYQYIKSGRLKASRIGRSWRISERNLRRFVDGE